MTIFISYKRENKDAVQRIVQGLRGAGLAVWWDQDIQPDAPWEQTIEAELEKAKVVIVAWSEAAVASENVKAEARRARNQGKLIQTFVEPCEPPLFFGERQGVDLSSWNGDASDHRFKTVLEAARAILAGKRPPQGVGYAPKKRQPWAAITAVLAFFSLVFGLVANIGGARDAVCEMAALNPYCIQYGLITVAETVDPAVVLAEQRENLMQALNGGWGRLDRDCVETVTFASERGDDDIYRIRSSAAGGFESVMQVTTIDTDNGVITARQTRPGEDGRREQWEYRPDGDVLAMRDSAGTETTLARCE
ncbi:MAG: toll/interleukin-1 receptor domain-containing protein [Hyphomonadaceae bacterium]